jgi:methylglutaconyl-CoA hydratase
MLKIDNPQSGIFQFTLQSAANHNALSPELISALQRGLEIVMAAPDAKVLLMQAEGKTFCSGADLTMLKRLQDADAAANERDALQLAALFETFAQFPLPVIGVLNGPAIAGGFGLICTFDYLLAADSESVYFRFSEVQLGFVPALISPFVLRRLPAAKARWLLLSGESLGLQEARDIGLIDATVAPEALNAKARDLAQKLLHNNSGQAMRQTKKLLNTLTDVSNPETRELTIAENTRARMTPACKAGIRAFLAGEKPDWQKLEKQRKK